MRNQDCWVSGWLDPGGFVYELTRTIDPAHFFPTIGDDVTAFREQFGIDWTRTAGKQAR